MPNVGEEDSDQPNYWLWVTQPEYYLEEDGETERADLDPGGGYEPGGWWTCHRDTEEGDQVLLYRAGLKKDIAYLIETRSDMYRLDDTYAAEQGWDYGCDYEVIEKFPKPLTYYEMKEDKALEDFGALRAKFFGHHGNWRIPPDIWDHLLDRLTDDRDKTDRRLKRVRKHHTLEREIEEQLAADLQPFREHGLKLDLRDRQHICRWGGRADLLCFDKKKKRHVVIELKRGLASRNAIAQLLSYCASIATEYPDGSRPQGILVGERLDTEAASMIDYNNDDLRFIPLGELGFS